ncbi:hypothetical protein XENORESO_017102, partial [Xenotaenia resolanae]
MIREAGVDIFVELDVGSDYNNEEQIRRVLYNVVKEGTIASYVTSVQGFQFRQLGKVTPIKRPCMADEYRCGDGTCIPMEYLCDNRPDCTDMSDETSCEMSVPLVLTTPAAVTPTLPGGLGPFGPQPPVPPIRCKADQAKCQSGECISQRFICDGQTDCQDGSDELGC